MDLIKFVNWEQSLPDPNEVFSESSISFGVLSVAADALISAFVDT